MPYHLLRCDASLSVGDPDSGNLLVQGDNLVALKALLPYYAGKVKCIYIDPPYNTGNEKWVYNDAVNSPEMRRWLGKVVGAEAEDLSRHDKWLCMMYPRLRLSGLPCVCLRVPTGGGKTLMACYAGWTVATLVNWLARRILHPNITLPQAASFIRNVVAGLMENRGITVEQLARKKFRLRNAVEAKIESHCQSQARGEYNRLLFGTGVSNIDVSADLCFEFQEDRYPANWYYEGSYVFRHRYFRQVGELGADGEEFECARFLDYLPEVAYRVRNLERRLESSFWLQTSTDRFYPDFVALLNDGRILVVESKGADRWSDDDSREKRTLGELWAERSQGRCLFVMPQGPNLETIRAVIKQPSKWALAAKNTLFSGDQA